MPGSRHTMVALCCVLAAATAAFAAVGVASAGQHIHSTPKTIALRTALMDPFLFPGGQQGQAFELARASGATYVRLLASWSSIAPSPRPQGFVAKDPSSPGYNWRGMDKTVAAAESAGLTPILEVQGTPSWALGKPARGRNAGTPKIPDLKAFSSALAQHYDDSSATPVHVYQVWNEPNLSLDLFPVNPTIYRSMVNAVATAAHGVDPANLVIAGGLDPFENHTPHWHSMAPLAFMRALLCVSKGSRPHKTCKQSIHFDVWSHHPYTFGGPFAHARYPDDVSLGDLPSMRAVLNAGERLHTVVSAHPPQFWVTEISWDTNPPRHGAPSLALQTRWTAEALHQMWLDKISLVTWFLLQDRPKSIYESGLYYSSPTLATAKAKPTLTAFRFPFVAYPAKHHSVAFWGRDGTSDSQVVTIQRRHGRSGKWATVGLIRANAVGIFRATLRVRTAKNDWFRAQAPGSGTSLSFAITQPKYPHLGPWGS